MKTRLTHPELGYPVDDHVADLLASANPKLAMELANAGLFPWSVIENR